MTSLAPRIGFRMVFGIEIVLIEQSHPVKHFAVVIIHQPGADAESRPALPAVRDRPLALCLALPIVTNTVGDDVPDLGKVPPSVPVASNSANCYKRGMFSACG